METNVESQFEQFDKKIIRRELLPIWIKIFCWLFMLMGVVSIACLIYGLFGKDAHLSFFGIETTKPISAIGIIVIAIMAFKGFTAYSLWFEKDNAIMLGKIDAISGVVICIFSMFAFILSDAHFNIRLEIALLIPFYMKLNKIEYEWDNLEEQ